MQVPDPSLPGQQGVKRVILTEKAALAWQYLRDPAIREVLAGGAKGGSKTTLGVYWVWARCEDLIRDFSIGIGRYPLPVGFMGRKVGKHFRDTTLETWKREIPQTGWEIREQAGEIVIRQRVKIDFGGLDETERTQKFNSAEYAFVFIDQAEELTRDDAGMLRATLRLAIRGQHPDYHILWTANPADCWLVPDFIRSTRPDRRYVQMLPSDNPHLPPEYVQAIKDAYGHRPELLQAYLYGSWDSLAGIKQVIKSAWVQAAGTKALIGASLRKVIACDPARFGDDETVIYYLENTDIKDADIFGQKDTMEVAGRLKIMAERHKGFPQERIPIAIDVTGGLGAGPADRLREMGEDVHDVNSSAKALRPDIYANLRAEMWWQAGKLFGSGDVVLTHNDDVLTSQLCSPSYDFKVGGQIIIESKDEIKARLNRSPDRADAYVIGLYALQFAEPVQAQQKEHRVRRQPETVSPWAL